MHALAPIYRAFGKRGSGEFEWKSSILAELKRSLAATPTKPRHSNTYCLSDRVRQGIRFLEPEHRDAVHGQRKHLNSPPKIPHCLSGLPGWGVLLYALSSVACITRAITRCNNMSFSQLKPPRETPFLTLDWALERGTRVVLSCPTTSPAILQAHCKCHRGTIGHWGVAWLVTAWNIQGFRHFDDIAEIHWELCFFYGRGGDPILVDFQYCLMLPWTFH